MDQAMIVLQGSEKCNRDLDTVPEEGCPRAAENETHIYCELGETQKSVRVTEDCRTGGFGGCALDVTVLLRNVPSGRAGMVELTLSEVDGSGAEHARGVRMVSIPEHSGPLAQDLELMPVRFTLPDGESMQRRHFILRTQRHGTDRSWG